SAPARRTLRWTAGLVAVTAAALAVIWFTSQRPSNVPTLSDPEPSIAVLPFDNIGGDPSLTYFGDGVAEDIITVLSRFPDIAVIARNSSFVYKGKAVDIREIGKELSVAYVLEGSVRKEADRVRITAQLIDSRSGQHVWAERCDNAGIDPWALQDEVIAK